MNKRNRTLIICGIIWAILAVTITILGFALSGADIIAWFSSKWAMYFYVFLGVYLLVIAIFFVIPMIRDRL